MWKNRKNSFIHLTIDLQLRDALSLLQTLHTKHLQCMGGMDCICNFLDSLKRTSERIRIFCRNYFSMCNWIQSTSKGDGFMEKVNSECIIDETRGQGRIRIPPGCRLLFSQKIADCMIISLK